MEDWLTILGIVIIGLLIIILLITVWFVPTICSRKNENAKPIFLINIFLGWIPIVWVAILIAALLGKKKDISTIM